MSLFYVAAYTVHNMYSVLITNLVIVFIFAHVLGKAHRTEQCSSVHDKVVLVLAFSKFCQNVVLLSQRLSNSSFSKYRDNSFESLAYWTHFQIICLPFQICFIACPPLFLDSGYKQVFLTEVWYISNILCKDSRLQVKCMSGSSNGTALKWKLVTPIHVNFALYWMAPQNDFIKYWLAIVWNLCCWILNQLTYLYTWQIHFVRPAQYISAIDGNCSFCDQW